LLDEQFALLSEKLFQPTKSVSIAVKPDRVNTEQENDEQSALPGR
jgi:hypothetical protein